MFTYTGETVKTKRVAEVVTTVTGESEVSNAIFFHEVKTGDPDHQVQSSEENVGLTPLQRILRWKKTILAPGVKIIWIFHGKQNVYWLSTLNLQDIHKISHAIGFLYFT